MVNNRLKIYNHVTGNLVKRIYMNNVKITCLDFSSDG